MSSDQEFCIEPECARPTMGYGDRCETHTKQHQRTGKCWPIAEKLSPRARFVEALIRAADAETDQEFEGAVRTAWNIATAEARSKMAAEMTGKEIDYLIAERRSLSIRKALRKAKLRGVRLGRPPRIDPDRVARMVRHHSPARVAKLLKVHPSWIWRLIAKSKIKKER